MQTLRAIRDIDQDGVTEDTFHDVSLGADGVKGLPGTRDWWRKEAEEQRAVGTCGREEASTSSLVAVGTILGQALPTRVSIYQSSLSLPVHLNLQFNGF